MIRYYKLDSRKVTYGEYWNMTRSPLVLIPWFAKCFGIPINFSSGMPAIDSMRDFEVSEADFSERARLKLQPWLDQYKGMGFFGERYFTYENLSRQSRVSVVSMLHESGVSLRLMHVTASSKQTVKENMVAVLLSQLGDGTHLCTSSQRKQFNSRPGVIVNRLVGASPERLMQSHLQKLEELKYTNGAKPVRTPEEQDELWDRYERLAQEFGLEQGRYVWMTPEEIAKQQDGIAEVNAVTATVGSQNADVLLAVHKLQNKKAGWGGIIAVLVISLAMFVIVGQSRWSWNYLMILLPVLFVHELGHYVAMRAFNYRNVRMFFIPFFGAAVSGQNFNVPGWKKVMVSLMGPVPGIVLGIILGMAGLIGHQPWLVKASIVCLILNGFNLLPILPLDGGWVFHTLIFSRHPALDTVFRVLAAFAMIIIGATLTTTKVMMYVGVMMLIGIPVAYRAAQIAADLKRRNLPMAAPDDQNLPPATADAIITEIKQRSPKPQSVNTIAAQTLQIFETINAHPPGWAATIGLLFVHMAALGLAVVFALGFAVAQRGDLRSLIAHPELIPKHALACGAVPEWRGSQWNPAADTINLVATYRRHADADVAYQSLNGQLPPNTALKCYGDTLLLNLPAGDDAARKKWLDTLQAGTKDVFADTTNYHAAFSVMFIAHDLTAATNIASQLDDYFETFPGEGLIPPWQRPDSRTPAQKAADELARQTYVRLQNSQFQDLTNWDVDALEKQADTARRQGNQTEADALGQQIRAQFQKMAQQNIERVRSGVLGPVDAGIIDLYTNLNDPIVETNLVEASRIRRELAQHMGQLPSQAVQTDTGSSVARAGNVSRNGLIITVSWVSFDSLYSGPQAFTDWVCDQGCIGVKYDFQAGMALFENDEGN